MDFAEMFQTWLRVLTKPGEEVMAEELDSPRASLGTALLWIIVAAVVGAGVNFLLSLVSLGTMGNLQREMMMQQGELPPELAGLFSTATMGGMIGAISFASIFITPILFLIGMGFYHLLATMLGGRGEYGRFAYLTSTFQAPIMIANSLLAVVPLLGGCLSIVLGIYSMVLQYFAVKVGYGLSSGRAITVILIPITLFLGVVICAIIALASTLIAISEQGLLAPHLIGF